MSFASITTNRTTASTARSDGTTASSVSSVSDIKLRQENLDDVFIFDLDTVVDNLFPEEDISFETQPSTAVDTLFQTTILSTQVNSWDLLQISLVCPDDNTLLEYTSVPDIDIDSRNSCYNNLFPSIKVDIN